MTKTAIFPILVVLGGASALGGMLWLRTRSSAGSPTTVQVTPGMPLDVQAYLQKRSAVSSTPAPKEVADRIRSVIRAGGASTPVPKDSALTVAKLLLEADADECAGRIVDVNGDGRPDLVIKRYCTGSGAAFELAVCLDGQNEVTYYAFSGSERGVTFFGTSRIPLEEHLLDREGGKALVIPECIVDRGADSVLNWPTVYSLRAGKFEVSDAEYKGFYDARVLPQFTRAGVPADDPDAKVVRELVRGLGR